MNENQESSSFEQELETLDFSALLENAEIDPELKVPVHRC